ncbi:MAG: hypothetical protein LBJ83_02875 [Oscillospiraceae bacterium]|jgi:hypothetical protein|nr:hypothetical protein [Oscillospiraceae bacterium]
MKVMRNTLLLFSLIIGVLCTACRFGTQTEYIAVYGDGKKIPTGIYVMYELSDALGSAMQKLREKDSTFYPHNLRSCFNCAIDGETMEELIEKIAKEKVTQYVGIITLFDELKLTLPTGKLEMLEQFAKIYDKKKMSLSENGVGKESYIACLEAKEKRAAIFDYYYGKDGKERPTKEEIGRYFEEKFFKVQTKIFYYGEQSAAQKAEVQKDAEAFRMRVTEEGFSKVLFSMEEESIKKEEKAKGTEPESGANIDSALSGEAKKPEEKVKETEANEEKLKNIEAASIEVLNEKQVINYYAESGRDEIKKLLPGETTLLDVKHHNMLVVLQKLPMTEEECEKREEEIIEEMKLEEFEKMLVELGNRQGIKFDEEIVKKFKSSKLKFKER